MYIMNTLGDIDFMMNYNDGFLVHRVLTGRGGLGYKPYNIKGGTLPKGTFSRVKNELQEQIKNVNEEYDLENVISEEVNDELSNIMAIYNELKHQKDDKSKIYFDYSNEDEIESYREREYNRQKEQYEVDEDIRQQNELFNPPIDEEKKKHIEKEIELYNQKLINTNEEIKNTESALRTLNVMNELTMGYVSNAKESGQYWKVKEFNSSIAQNKQKIVKNNNLLLKQKEEKKEYQQNILKLNEDLERLLDKEDKESIKEEIEESQEFKNIISSMDFSDDSNNNAVQEALKLRNKYGNEEGGKKMEKYTLNKYPSLLGEDYRNQNYVLTDTENTSNADFYIFDIKGKDKDWEMKTKLAYSMKNISDKFKSELKEAYDNAKLFGEDFDLKVFLKNIEGGLPLTANKITGGQGDFIPYYKGKPGDMKLWSVYDTSGKNKGSLTSKDVSTIFFLKDGVFTYDITKDKNIRRIPVEGYDGVYRLSLEGVYPKNKYGEYLIPPYLLRQIK